MEYWTNHNYERRPLQCCDHSDTYCERVKTEPAQLILYACNTSHVGKQGDYSQTSCTAVSYELNRWPLFVKKKEYFSNVLCLSKSTEKKSLIILLLGGRGIEFILASRVGTEVFERSSILTRRTLSAVEHCHSEKRRENDGSSWPAYNIVQSASICL